ncbi:alpha/beta fold hydrolase [Spirilliplanes yamanashiensis]|uniref:Hydrolase n=1 Tax=Spirilliplanes yamanashiensis TaxID=42233 RepID=A0A8J4DIE6_9ACTN|nr:alpha/beta fold hydrolase [Spirilliplanes yamanashiensis]MDP9819302.1 pimeloyl-ACP methyl ester carboxylesterase [Spirilliplanes yamanashiensis]GIJ01875.1 hydrolase [Spirilliplanes yamanashiensis]
MTISAGTAWAIDRVVTTDDGARLAVTVTTPGRTTEPTVVLAHGWGAGRAVWRGVTDRLVAAGHAVVAYDQRGHGDSTAGTGPVSISRLGDDLDAVLAAVDARGAILAGHSGGGFAALAYATGHPMGATIRLRGLVLLATAAHDQDTPAGEVRMMGNPVFSWALRRPALGRRMLRQTLGENPSAAVQELNRELFAATPGAVRAACFACSRGMDLRPQLAQVHVPAVVLAGARDTVVAPRLGEAVAAALPAARYELLPGAGHMLPLEAPAAVAAAVRDLSTAG